MIVSFPVFEKNRQTWLQKGKKIHKGEGSAAFIDIFRLHGSCQVTNRPFWAAKGSWCALTLNFILLLSSE